MARDALIERAAAEARGTHDGLRLRRTPRESDIDAVRRLAAGVGVFSKAEQAVAVELIETRLRDGRKSGYHFAFADLGGRTVGYCVWGPVPMTAASWDLYWIVVDPACRGLGAGRRLLDEAECDVARRGGGTVYVETSSRPDYARTRRFYRKAGYRTAARLRDFYAAGDDKIIYRKSVAGASPRRARAV
ncbi:MAG TPA: N-acetyltransferase [Gammaproteobacteria bacterium]